MTARVRLVRHGKGPADDRVVSHLLMNGYEVDIRRPFEGDTLGEVDGDIAGTVVFGGNYNSFDTEMHPFLKEEYRWIEAALKADIPLVGICQGAQMLARHLGAWAGPLDPEVYEFGMYEIRPTEAGRHFLPEPLMMFQAHYHTFDLPEGAVHLAESDYFPNQAFSMGDKVFGLQFHAEQTIDSFRRWQQSDDNYLGKPGAQSLAEQKTLMAEHDEAQAAWFFRFFSTLFPKVDP